MLQNSIRFDAIGTHWQIDTNEKIPDRLLNKIHSRIEAYDKTYSRFRPDSLFTRVALKKGLYEFPDDAQHVIEFYHNLYKLTDGRVTPLIGSMLERAGYDANYSFQSKPQQQLPKWEEVLDWNGSTLQTTSPVTLDIGAAGKGYLIDLIAAIFDKAMIRDYVIDASGDLRHRGLSKNLVGLEHPFEHIRIIGVVDVRNGSICASATNRRSWGSNMHHIFDPLTKAPVEDIVATWVMSKEAMIADGLATALFFVDSEILASHYDFQYVRMYKDGTIDYSRGFKGELFI